MVVDNADQEDVHRRVLSYCSCPECGCSVSSRVVVQPDSISGGYPFDGYIIPSEDCYVLEIECIECGTRVRTNFVKSSHVVHSKRRYTRMDSKLAGKCIHTASIDAETMKFSEYFTRSGCHWRKDVDYSNHWDYQGKHHVSFKVATHLGTGEIVFPKENRIANMAIYHQLRFPLKEMWQEHVREWWKRTASQRKRK